VCLAHTIKNEGRRPTMDDLRGSKMISAFADVVTFLYRPWQTLTKEERDRGLGAREEYELVHDKVRQADSGVGDLWMDLSRMAIR
jgi:replicative DNA helicase